MGRPSFVENCLRLIFELCQHPLISQATLAHLETRWYYKCQVCGYTDLISGTQFACSCASAALARLDQESFLTLMLNHVVGISQKNLSRDSMLRTPTQRQDRASGDESVSTLYQTTWLLKIVAILLRTRCHGNVDANQGLAGGGDAYQSVLNTLLPATHFGDDPETAPQQWDERDA
ncbi:hypothetical protein SARC_18078, partial [Sphaeroforma arctica JP610]